MTVNSNLTAALINLSLGREGIARAFLHALAALAAPAPSDMVAPSVFHALDDAGSLYAVSAADLLPVLNGLALPAVLRVAGGVGRADEGTLALVGEFDGTKWAAQFKRLFPESDEGLMHGWFANAIMAGYDHRYNETRDDVQALDALLNGVPTGATLAQLVDQVRARQAVQIVNFEDGMRINFRAPDGERATMYLASVLEAGENDFSPHFDEGTPATMRAAIADYPVVQGLPVGEEPEQGLDSMGRLP